VQRGPWERLVVGDSILECRPLRVTLHEGTALGEIECWVLARVQVAGGDSLWREGVDCGEERAWRSRAEGGVCLKTCIGNESLAAMGEIALNVRGGDRERLSFLHIPLSWKDLDRVCP
jgi:hypothetical protein